MLRRKRLFKVRWPRTKVIRRGRKFFDIEYQWWNSGLLITEGEFGEELVMPVVFTMTHGKPDTPFSNDRVSSYARTNNFGRVVQFADYDKRGHTYRGGRNTTLTRCAPT